MKKIYSAVFIALFSVSAFVAGAVELETKFLSYMVPGQVTSTINDADSTISVFMAAGTDLSSLVPEFTLSEGAKAFRGDVEQVSGTTVDFSQGAVNYNVVNDTVEQMWYVTATNVVQVTFNVDMTNAELAEGDVVYVTGSFVGWNEPGTGASILMSDDDGDNIYSATAYVAENSGRITYKYFRNATWANGDPYNGGTDRWLQIGAANVNVDPVDVWAEETVRVTFNVDMANAEMTETDVVYVTGSFVGWNEPGTGKSVLMTYNEADEEWTATVPVAANAGDIQYKYFLNATWANGDPFNNGTDRTLTVADANITIDPADVWNGVIDAINQDAFSNLAVYPNPFNNILTIENLDNASEVIVSTLIGQVLEVKAVVDTKVTVNTSELKAGIYLVVVKDAEGNSKAIRVVKQ